MGEEYRENSVLTPEQDLLIAAVVKHHMEHNAEAEAVDLLMELERLDLLTDYVDEHSEQRVCLYLLA